MQGRVLFERFEGWPEAGLSEGLAGVLVGEEAVPHLRVDGVQRVAGFDEDDPERSSLAVF